MNRRLASRGPYILGPRFSVADFYLCFWIAYLDVDGVCDRCPQVANLYELVRSRPSASRYLDETERAAASYAEMLKRTPGGVIS
ncbi:glutathione S-transferase C-terminal domain-containing protein [Ensifer adhaerens]|nr:glutathione S-transferase family protein [Ensifer adhaerens]MBZ7925075.1 glutathione S-transferase C-terminal domain-containing protein [Ensifer adhaerens]UAX95734.1 glutathione S-transferase C-terminal domain-containing protein [Ensifer adhaerens]UAY04925.1 glutathione S-transferase C-terminal domain-containing protein [Ensifer adhaerens]UAY10357.1 glutathione S-transferase C-terminal domain-containing protein [Ensifer adhaerens]